MFAKRYLRLFPSVRDARGPTRRNNVCRAGKRANADGHSWSVVRSGNRIWCIVWVPVLLILFLSPTDQLINELWPAKHFRRSH